MSVSAPPVTADSVAEQVAGVGHDVAVNYVLQSGYLVFFMHCGFAMLSIGCVRTRFAKHIAILILVDACASAVAYYLFGYAFAFGDTQTVVDGSITYSGNPFLGTNFFAMSGLPHDEWYLWLFQWSVRPAALLAALALLPDACLQQAAVSTLSPHAGTRPGWALGSVG